MPPTLLPPPTASSLRPVGPKLLGDISHQLQLLEHDIFVHALTSNTSAGKTTLWANANVLHGFFLRPTLTLGNELREMNLTIESETVKNGGNGSY